LPPKIEVITGEENEEVDLLHNKLWIWDSFLES
jgi:hypothetical protein